MTKMKVTGVTPGKKLAPGDILSQDVNGNFRKAEVGAVIDNGYVFVGGESNVIVGTPHNIIFGHKHRIFTGIASETVRKLQDYIAEKLPAGGSEVGFNYSTFNGYFIQVQHLGEKYFDRVIEPYLRYFAVSHECRIRYTYHPHARMLNMWCQPDTFPEVQYAEKVTWENHEECGVDHFLISGDWKHADED
jgi:hypothetical protein